MQIREQQDVPARATSEDQIAVILIEDDAGLAELIRRSLRRELDIRAVVVPTGAEGIAATKEHANALLLIDYSLPDMLATDVVRALIQEGVSRDFVVITGQGDERVAVEMMKSGARDYLVKDAVFLDRLPTAIKKVMHDIDRDRRLRESEDARRAMEVQLRQAQKLESIGTLAGGVAHEINNPINGIMNYAQLIKDRIKDRDETIADFASEIIVETERIATIVANLLGFARRDEKQALSMAKPVDVVNSTLSLVKTVLRHDQIALTMKIPDDLPPVRCQSQQLQQVLMNLVTNARDALNEKYPAYDENKRLTVSAAVSEIDGHRWLRFTVEDQGNGVSDEALDRLFEPFFTTKKPDKGTGLGLSISHGIVKNHGGELSVETEPGQWTRFHVDLPLEDST